MEHAVNNWTVFLYGHFLACVEDYLLFFFFEPSLLYCHNLSLSPSLKSKVKSQKDLEWLYSAVQHYHHLPPTTTNTLIQIKN